jgi:hypothetical protein
MSPILHISREREQDALGLLRVACGGEHQCQLARELGQRKKQKKNRGRTADVDLKRTKTDGQYLLRWLSTSSL